MPIGVIDYGAGNLMSVTNSLAYLGLNYLVSDQTADLNRADRLILPGVGAFPAAMKRLEAKGLVDYIKSRAHNEPVLGICLGMQMLFDESDEIHVCSGLSLIPGKVMKPSTSFKLPHIGWNSLEFKNKCKLLTGVPDGSFVYFVHSYHAVPASPSNLSATAGYGTDITAIAQNGNVFGCQFHPEKSGEAGLAILENFARL